MICGIILYKTDKAKKRECGGIGRERGEFMDKELVDIFIRNHTFNTIYVQRHIWEKIPDIWRASPS